MNLSSESIPYDHQKFSDRTFWQKAASDFGGFLKNNQMISTCIARSPTNLQQMGLSRQIAFSPLELVRRNQGELAGFNANLALLT